MGFLDNYYKQRKEQKAFSSIVAQKTKVAGRQAYADEAVKVARERARAKARQPQSNVMSSIGSFLYQNTLAPIPQKKSSGVRRVRVKVGKGKKVRYVTRTRTIAPPVQQQPQLYSTEEFFRTTGGF